jgi:hypothetical protein
MLVAVHGADDLTDEALEYFLIRGAVQSSPAGRGAPATSSGSSSSATWRAMLLSISGRAKS